VDETIDRLTPVPDGEENMREQAGDIESCPPPVFEDGTPSDPRAWVS
jgi:hypothetical protein